MTSTAELLRNTAYRRLLAGRIVTNAGDSLYFVGATWLVYELTGSTVYTGLAGFLVFLPRGFRFLTGPIVDRWPLRPLLVGAQLVQAVGVLTVPVAASLGHLSVGVVLVVFPLLAVVNQFVYPAQYTALPRIVSEEALTRANSAFSFAEEGTNMAFNALGGLLIGIVGAVALYVVDAVTFVVAMFLFAGVQIPPALATSEDDSGDDGGGYVAELTEGFQSIRGSVWEPIILVGTISNFNVGIAVAVLPAFASVRGGPVLYGALSAAFGAGLALGAVGASRLEWAPLGRLWTVGYGVGCLLWLGTVYVPWAPVSVALFVLAWIPPGVTNVLENAMLQTVVADDLLGRVMAVSSSASWAALPVGSLVGGPISSVFGSVTTMALAASGWGIISVLFVVHPRLRQLPAVTALETTDYEFNLEV